MFAATVARAELIYYKVSAPLVQQSTLQGAPGSITETFNSYPSIEIGNPGDTYNLTVGTLKVLQRAYGPGFRPPDVYGGAGSTQQYGGDGSGQYLYTGIFDVDAYEISLAAPSRYIGFLWGTGNTGNTIKFYGAGDVLLGTYSTAQLMSDLSGNVVAWDGNTYAGSDYSKNYQGNGTYNNEPWAYLNLALDDENTYFTNVVFGGAGFEVDNLTISSEYQLSAAVPEPGTWAAAALLVGGAAFARWRKRRDEAQKEAA
jgi:hypothetical protein